MLPLLRNVSGNNRGDPVKEEGKETKPLVGVTMAVDVAEYRVHVLNYYAVALEKAGGTCVYLPLATPGLCAALMPRLDGLILSGGGDIPAHLLNESLHPASKPIPVERWESECLWLRTAMDHGKPVLGICLGMQIMCAAAGGSILQDIPSMLPDALPHRNPQEDALHTVRLTPGSRLAAWAGAEEKIVTSSHHQAVRQIPAHYRATAHTPDGIVEGVERDGDDFMVGAQWHPERNPEQPDWLIRAFVDACERARAAAAGR
jgi:putative glutamine amidotransferase